MRRSLLDVIFVTASSLVLGACPEEKPRKVGETCAIDGECESGQCADNRCLAPEGDEDEDGIINRIEQLIGSDPLSADSDLDGIEDGAELTASQDLVDTDGDTIADIVESRTADADGDCITDQLDADDEVPSTDLSPMRDVVCRLDGLCAGQLAALQVACPADEAVCIYDAVVGFADPEPTCDGIDQNCDGVEDEGFPDLDADGVADCVDSDADGDDVTDLRDNCLGLANPDQNDAQNDGVGDACEAGKALVFTAAPGAVDAGSPFTVVVTLEDEAGAVVETFTGVVTLSIDDAAGLTSASGVAVAGVATLDAVIATHAGLDWVLTATSGPFEVTQQGFDVAPGPAAELVVTLGPAAEDAVLAGVASDVTVEAEDAYGNTVTDYAGTVTLTTDDVNASVPEAYTFITADEGIHVFEGLVLETAGVHTVSATDGDGGASGTATVEVQHGAAEAVLFEGAPGSVVAGDAIDLAFVLVDAYDNVALDFAGLVTLTSDDPNATLPAAVTVANGRGHFAGIRLTRPGATTLTASFDGGEGVVSIVVGTGQAAGLRIVEAPATIVAGEAFTLALEAIDASGNLATTFAGDVALTVDDAGATLPATVTFGLADVGRKVVAVTLERSGPRTLQARELASGISTTSVVEVAAAAATRLELGALPGSVVAGVPQAVSLTFFDAYDNVASVTQAVDVSTNDPAGRFASDPVEVVAGVGTVVVTFETSGARTLTATAGALSDTATTNVSAASQVALRVFDLPATTTAGSDHLLRVAAVDGFGNTVTSVSGAATVASSDAEYVGPSALTLVDGQATFTARLVTAGSRRITVSHASGVGIADTTVTPAPFTVLRVDGLPAALVAGSSWTIDVIALDAFGNLVDEDGPAAIGSSDPDYVGPDSVTLVDGQAAFIARLETLGDQRVTATRAGVEGFDATVVQPAPAAAFVVTGMPVTVVAGTVVALSVVTRDAFGNTAAFNGTANLTSGDSFVDFSADTITFENGLASFEVTFGRAGTQGVTVTSGALSGSASTSVTAGAAAKYELLDLPTSVVAGTSHTINAYAVDAFDNVSTSYVAAAVAVSSGDATFEGPSTVAFANGTSSFAVAFGTPGPQAVTLTSGALTGTAATSVAPADLAAVSLTGLPADVTAGATVTLTVTALDDLGNTVFYDGDGVLDPDDAEASMDPDPLELVSGVATVQVTFRTAGAKTVTATVGGFSDAAQTNVAAAALADLRLLDLPASVVAGAQHTVRVVAVDAFDNLVNVGGAVQVTSTDPAYEGPPSVTLVGGIAQLQARFKTVGARELKVTQGSFEDVATTDVGVGPMSRLVMTGLPTTLIAGDTATLAIHAQDAFGNDVTSFATPGDFTITGTGGSVSQDPVPFNDGVASATVRFVNVGSKTVAISAAGFSDAQSTSVTAAAYTTLKLIDLPATSNAGQSYTVRAVTVDAFDNVVPTTTGSVAVASSDPELIGPTGVPLTSGVAQFAVTHRTADVQTVTVTHDGKQGEQSTTVAPAALSALVISELPAAMTAGVAEPIEVTAVDAFGNTVESYGGGGTFTVQDGSAAPSAVTFSQGVVTSSVTITKVGSKTVRIDSGTLSATANTTVGAAAYADLKLVGLPPTVGAGSLHGLTLVAVDAFDNLVPTVAGLVTVTSSDDDYVGPASVTLASGTVTFDARLSTAGQQTITVTQDDKSDTATTNVTSGAVASLELTGLPANMTAGDTALLTVVAKDAAGNTVTSFSESGTFAGTDAAFTPSANVTFVNGSATVTVRYTKAGAHVLGVTAGALSDTASTSVAAAAYADVRLLGLPASVAAGEQRTLQAVAVDQFGNSVPGTPGGVSISSSDLQFEGPASVSFGPTGVASFNVRLKTAGAQTVSIVDGAFADEVATSVQRGPVHHLVLSGVPSTTVAGTTLTVKAIAKDAFENTVTDYGLGGTFSGSNISFVPSAVTFVAGEATSEMTITQVGAKTPRIDSDGRNATASINVTAAAYADVRLLGLGASMNAGETRALTVLAVDTYNNLVPTIGGEVVIESTDPQYDGPSSVTMATGQATFDARLLTAGTQSITAKKDGHDDTRATNVLVGPLAGFAFSGLPETMVAGESATVEVEAQDAFGNRVTTFGGSVAVDFGDNEVSTNPLELTAGRATLDVLVTRAGTQELVLTAGATEDSVATTVAAGPYAGLRLVGLPSETVAGTSLPATIVAIDDYGNVTPVDLEVALTVGSSEQEPDTIVLDAGVAEVEVVLTRSGNQYVTVSDGDASDDVLVIVRAGPATRVDHGIYPDPIGIGQSFQLLVFVTDAYDNIVRDFVGVVTLSSDDVSMLVDDEPAPAALQFTAADNGVRRPLIQLFSPGLKHIDLESPPYDAAGFDTFVQGEPTRVALQLTRDSFQPAQVGAPIDTLAVTLVDEGGQPTSLPDDLVVQLAVDYASPGPAHIIGQRDYLIAAGTSTITIDDVALDRDGRFSLRADAEGVDPGFMPIFDVEAMGTISVYDIQRHGGCVEITYDVTTSNDLRFDLEPEWWVDDAPRRMTQGAARELGTSGTSRLAPGFHRFVWNAARDLGAFDGFVNVRLVARPGHPMMPAQPIISDIIEVGAELAPRWQVHTGDFALKSVDVSSGDYEGDGTPDVARVLPNGLYLDTSSNGSAFFGEDGSSDVIRAASGDLDYTGIDELLTLARGLRKVRVYYITDPIAETFVEDFEVCAGGAPEDLAVVEISGDYRQIVVVCSGTRTLEIWSRGGPAYERLHVLALAGEPSSLVVNDLDRDGDPDFVIGTSSGVNVVSLVPGSQLPELALAQVLPTPGAITAVAAADFDRDALVDVVTVDAAGKVDMYSGSESGEHLLIPSPNDYDGPDFTLHVIADDLDGDGCPDLAFTTGIQPLIIERNDCSGHFAPQLVDAQPNGAGRLDRQGASIIFSVPPGTPGAPSWGRADLQPVAPCEIEVDTFMAAPPRLDGSFVKAGDVNADGKPDLVTGGNPDERGIQVALGRGDGGFHADHIAVADHVDNVVVGSFSGDALPDLAYISDGELVVLRHSGDANALEYDTIGTVSVADGVLAVADLDGDGFDDLVFNDVDGVLSVAYPRFDGSEHGIDVVAIGVTDVFEVVPANVDARGDLDLVVLHSASVDPEGTALQVCRIDSGATPRSHGGLACMTITTEDGARVDSLAVERSFTTQIRAFYRVTSPEAAPTIMASEMREAPAPGEPVTIDLCNEGVEDFALGHFDATTKAWQGDQREDLAAVCEGSESGERVAFLRRVAYGDSDQSGSLPFALGSESLAVDDFDGNGVSDVANGRGVLPLLPDPDGLTARRHTTLSIGAVDPDAIVVHDVTGDGVPDVVTATVVTRTLPFPPPYGVTLRLRVISPFAASPWDVFGNHDITLCSGTDCPTDWRALLAVGDVTGDRRDDVLLAYGYDEASSSLRSFAVDRAGGLQALPPVYEGAHELGFVPRVLVVGDIFYDDHGSPDIMVAGVDGSATPRIRVVHREGIASTETFPAVFYEGGPNQLPRDIQAGFIGSFDTETGNCNVALLDREGQDLWFLDVGGCDSEHPDCVALVRRVLPFDGTQTGGSWTIEGIASASLGDSADAFVVSVVQGVEGGKRQMVVRSTFDGGAMQYTPIAMRDYGTQGEVEPSFGPFLADVDRDGFTDTVVAWREGRSWVVYPGHPDQGTPYMFGGFAAARGRQALFVDVDGNRRVDAILLEHDASEALLLNQGMPQLSDPSE